MEDVSRWPKKAVATNPDGQENQWPLRWPKNSCAIPKTVDDEDRVLDAFLGRHPELEGKLHIGDTYLLPGALWQLSLCRLVSTLPDLLKNASVLMAPDFQVAFQVGVDGGEQRGTSGAAESEAIVQANLRKYFREDSTLAEWAAVCYRAPEKQRSLVELRDANPLTPPLKSGVSERLKSSLRGALCYLRTTATQLHTRRVCFSREARL